MSFWYNVTTGQVEIDENRSRGGQVLGPYASEAEAQVALETARENTEKWDEADREWDELPSDRADGGADTGAADAGQH